ADKEAAPAGGREGEGLQPLGTQDGVVEAHAWTIEHLECNLHGVGVAAGSPEPDYHSQRHHTRDHELRPGSVPMSYGHHTTPLVQGIRASWQGRQSRKSSALMRLSVAARGRASYGHGASHASPSAGELSNCPLDAG